MSDKIDPVLTAREWAHWLGENDDLRLQIDAACDGVGYSLRQDPAALIALANAALPDDSPYKITRADAIATANAATLLNAVQELAPDAPDDLGVGYGITHLRNLAAKLAALLPPE